MKKYILIFQLFILSYTYAYENPALYYMPLHVGDFWVYRASLYTMPGGTINWKEKYLITHSRNVNGHLYYYLVVQSPYPIYSYFRTNYYRVDSLTGNIFSYDSTNGCPKYNYENMLDSLAASNNDSVHFCIPGGYVCHGTTKMFLFSDSVDVVSFGRSQQYGGNYSGYTKKYARNFGFYNYSVTSYGGGSNSAMSFTLIGCRINGVLIGDTSMVGIRILNSSVPEEFSLHQNYPNPFNPSTTIKFDLPKTSDVRLSVYDITGKEIETLVNEKLNAGSYETKWDGSKYVSGVYFCRIMYGDFTDAIKIILLK